MKTQIEIEAPDFEGSAMEIGHEVWSRICEPLIVKMAAVDQSAPIEFCCGIFSALTGFFIEQIGADTTADFLMAFADAARKTAQVEKDAAK